MKNILRIITAVILFGYLGYACYHFIVYPIHPKYLDCGKVISKSNDEIPIKYGTRTELYLNIQFESSGFMSVSCTPTTYFSKSVGDSVCFDLDERTSFWYDIHNVNGLLVLILCALSLIILFIGYLIEGVYE